MEILIIALVVILFFGAKRIPEIGRSLGTGMREFKQGIGFSGGGDEPEKAPLEAADDDELERRERSAGARASR